jgi:rfaE bifunctional protein nucleotidyltransferase chain/domain
MTKLELIHSKIQSGIELDRQLNVWRFKDKKIVFTNGCFDIIHPGHITLLAQAADLGDVLIVGLNSDKSIKAIKGDKRPINNQDYRSIMLAAMKYVDMVVLFDETTPENLIKHIKPDILVKGSDYDKMNIVGADFVKSYGGLIKTIDILPGYSTSSIIEKLKSL